MPPKKTHKTSKSVTRFEYGVDEPRTPETGHTALLPEADQVVEVDMGERWAGQLRIASPDADRVVVVDMDPYLDPSLLWSGKNGAVVADDNADLPTESQPTLLWAGKSSRRDVSVLPLQRTEIVAASRIAQITERARARAAQSTAVQGSFFEEEERELRERERDKRVEFYTHGESWKNKLICGDSLEVMESLIHYERLAGQVQMAFIDPPYGIGYDSNFQQRVGLSRNDKDDGSDDVVAVKAYRDTWSLGIHSYLTYLAERIYLIRELLAPSGSVFVQINVENEHYVRLLLDEVLGRDNYVTTVVFNKTTGFTDKRLSGVYDLLVWYAKDASRMKYRQLYQRKNVGLEGAGVYRRVELPDGSRRMLSGKELQSIDELPSDWRVFTLSDISSQGASGEPDPWEFEGRTYLPPANCHWKPAKAGRAPLVEKRRVAVSGTSLRYVRYWDDFPVSPISNVWMDTGTGSFTEAKVYPVQTGSKVVQRCIFMTTDPGDLVLDITCGSGTTAVNAERLGRRWITCDTSRVAINTARQRMLSQLFEAYRTVNGDPSSGFIYQTVPRVTLKSVAYDLEPEQISLVDRPEVDDSAVRVCGPFEMLSLGRYSPDEWRGSLVGGEDDPEKLANYVEVIARLYRPHAEAMEGAQAVHATFESEDEHLAISIGPLTGRVLASQIDDAARQAAEMNFSELHVLGWAFEVNVGELRDRLATELGVKIELVMIRPDTLAEGLKVTNRVELFSPLSLPEIEIVPEPDGMVSVRLLGVTVFDRKQRKAQWKDADSNYVIAWYLDHDYDGDCFVASEFFFDFAKHHRKLATVARAEIEKSEFELVFRSSSFVPGDGGRVAVKVVDIYGYESTVVKTVER